MTKPTRTAALQLLRELEAEGDDPVLGRHVRQLCEELDVAEKKCETCKHWGGPRGGQQAKRTKT